MIRQYWNKKERKSYTLSPVFVDKVGDAARCTTITLQIHHNKQHRITFHQTQSYHNTTPPPHQQQQQQQPPQPPQPPQTTQQQQQPPQPPPPPDYRDLRPPEPLRSWLVPGA
ncbi:hypothetical protein Pmani_028606 [Petrolisthes manimaculis]|uniref:Uncharacterized protein n=1 Tax=Petrolisthes manimaculis TaxID=1843537 RepID=A0AAE1P0X2_9EUCA|nr:hypothetical protein Pmani_028606 [Petrolisthes manimaculis]